MAWIAVGVAVAGVAIQAGSAISANKRANAGLDYKMTADELKAAYQRDLSTTLNFEQWAQMQTTSYNDLNKSAASSNTMAYAGAAVVVLVGGISMLYLLKKD